MSIEQHLATIIRNVEETFAIVHNQDQNSEIIDVKRFRSRESYIQMLNNASKLISNLSESISNKRDILNAKHESDLELIKMISQPHAPSALPVASPVTLALPSTVNTSSTTSVTSPPAPPKFLAAIAHNNIKQISPEKFTQSDEPEAENKTVTVINKSLRAVAPSQVPITSKYTLNAIKVGTWSDLRNKMTPGVLYYVESNNHFAILIAGMFIHGNIGKIYTKEKDPVKIKNCLYGSKCTKENCDYYHNPLRNPSALHSKDCRNFIATSWIYSSPEQPYKNKHKSRRFGDLDYIDFDIEEMNSEEGERYLDQTMHDLLCAILLNQYRKFTN